MFIKSIIHMLIYNRKEGYFMSMTYLSCINCHQSDLVDDAKAIPGTLLCNDCLEKVKKGELDLNEINDRPSDAFIIQNAKDVFCNHCDDKECNNCKVQKIANSF